MRSPWIVRGFWQYSKFNIELVIISRDKWGCRLYSRQNLAWQKMPLGFFSRDFLESVFGNGELSQWAEEVQEDPTVEYNMNHPPICHPLFYPAQDPEKERECTSYLSGGCRTWRLKEESDMVELNLFGVGIIWDQPIWDPIVIPIENPDT